jgi:uncharacterized protein
VSSKKDFHKYAKFLASFSLFVAAITVVVGLKSLHLLKTEYSVMQFLPAHHPALQMDEDVRKLFHLEDKPVFIGLLNLHNEEKESWLIPGRIERLAKLTKTVSDIESVQVALSVANVVGAASEGDELSVGELTRLVPQKDWAKRILKDPLLTPNLISADARTVLLFVQLKGADVTDMVAIEQTMNKLLAETFPEANTSVGGVPAIQTDLGLLLNKELINFLLLTILACALTLLLIFRTYSTIWIPLILTLYCNLMVFTMMAWSGIPFTVLSATLPILVFIDVMTISCHILLRYNEESARPKANETRLLLILRTIRRIWLPNALGSLTTSVGFLTLLFSDVPLIRSYGTAVAVSILMSSLLTTIGIIPLLLLLPSPAPREWVHRPARWALWILANRKMIVGSTLALAFVFAFIGRHLDWTGRLFDDLPKDQAARISTEKIDATMGGVVPLEVVIRLPEGHDWVEPVEVAKLDHLVTDLRALEGIGTTQSLPDYFRASSIQKAAGIPATRAEIAEIYFLYTMSTDNPLTQFVTNDNRSARIEMKIHDLPGNQVQALLAQITKQVSATFPESAVQIGGMGAVVHTIHDEISSELIFGFWQALILIVGLLMFVFRSVRWALVAALPNLVPPVMLLGYLSLTHTPIKPGVAIIFSIALGLAFTNTVYILSRLKELRKRNGRFPISKTFYLESNPCLVSTLVVMVGFSVFLGSYFELNRTFGACMLVSIAAGILGDLIFLPALLKMAPWLLGNVPVVRPRPKLYLVPPLPKEPEATIDEIEERSAA